MSIPSTPQRVTCLVPSSPPRNATQRRPWNYCVKPSASFPIRICSWPRFCFGEAPQRRRKMSCASIWPCPARKRNKTWSVGSLGSRRNQLQTEQQNGLAEEVHRRARSPLGGLAEGPHAFANSLLIPQRFHRIEPRRFDRWIHAKKKSNTHRHGHRQQYRPHGYVGR